jgi:hypothetical protein
MKRKTRPWTSPERRILSKAGSRGTRQPPLKETGSLFRHVPIDHSVASIRLVQVLPELSPCGLIQCTILHTTVDSALYTCLSYEWGPADQGDWISINFKPHYVRRNLLDFLETARRYHHSKALWIDALCIDQTNDFERNHQVQMMGVIYSRAVEVLPWLGNDCTTAWLIALLSEKYPQKIKLRTIGSDWEVMCKNSYWTRAWITQEITLARKVRLLAGDQDIEEFRLPKFTIPIFSSARSVRHRDRSLLYLLHEFRGQQCAVNRDRIFSLLSLCREGSDVKVDYSVPDTEVMVQVLGACEKSLCFCSVAIVAEALDLRQLPELEVTLRDFQFAPLRFDFGNQTYCPTCNEMIDLTRTRMVGHLFCLGSVCPDIGRHLFWERLPSETTSRFCIIERPNKHYLASIRRNLEPKEEGKHSIQLPLQMFLDLEPSPNISKDHLYQNKEPMRLYDQLSSVPPDQHLWDTEFGSNTDSSNTDSDVEIRGIADHSTFVYRDQMIVRSNTPYEKYPLPPSELNV